MLATLPSSSCTWLPSSSSHFLLSCLVRTEGSGRRGGRSSGLLLSSGCAEPGERGGGSSPAADGHDDGTGVPGRRGGTPTCLPFSSGCAEPGERGGGSSPTADGHDDGTGVPGRRGGTPPSCLLSCSGDPGEGGCRLSTAAEAQGGRMETCREKGQILVQKWPNGNPNEYGSEHLPMQIITEVLKYYVH